MNITMIGTGYVGLVSGTIFAELGHNVTCVDTDQSKIDKLNNQGLIPIYEPGLQEMVAKNTKAGRLHFTTNLSASVPTSDAVFIAVGTPEGEDGSADLQYVLSAAESIAKNLGDKFTVIVDKSTVPVGTARKVTDVVKQTNPSARFEVTSNPEFLREGHAIEDFIKPDRVVVGARSEQAKQVMEAVYKPLTEKGYPLLITDVESAEMIKYAANAFLATKITFINEIAALCEKIDGANVEDVAKGIGMDSRIGSKFLQAGPGWGGSCFPKDTKALTKIAAEYGEQVAIVEAALNRNEDIKRRMADKIEQTCGSLTGKTISILGLAFKADTDDMRDAPALTIIPELLSRGAKVKAYDPEATEQAKRALPQEVHFCASADEALEQAHCAVALTEWQEIRNLELSHIKEKLAEANLVDLRNLYSPEQAQKLGFNYNRIGF